MKIEHIAMYMLLGVALTACSSDTAPFGEANAESSYLDVDVSQLSFDLDRSATVNVNAAEDLSWSVSPSDSWIKIDRRSATGSNSISISVDGDNPNTTPRSGRVSLMSDRYHLSKSISVSQSGTYLNVDKDEVYFPIQGGSGTIAVESNASWSVIRDSLSWLTTNAPSGQRGNGSFTFTVKANTEEFERSALIGVYTNNQAVSRFITIDQQPIVLSIAGSDINARPEGGEYNVQITSTSSWTASSGANWCSVSPNSGIENGMVHLSVSANMGTSNRNTTFMVKSGDVVRSIRVAQESATLSINDSPISIGPKAYSKTLAVSSNTSWTASSNAAWCTVRQGDGELTISATRNETDTPRTANVTVQALGITKTIKVTQQNATLALSPSATMSFNPESSSESLQITSNVEWTASSNANWCTLNATSGTGDKTITVSATENRTGSQRTAVITVKTAFHEKTITVKQANATLSVSKETIAFGGGQASAVVAITTNTNWTVTCNPSSWLSVTPNVGNGNASITIRANANSSSSSREGTVTVTAGELSKTIRISQERSETPNEDDNTTPQYNVRK